MHRPKACLRIPIYYGRNASLGRLTGLDVPFVVVLMLIDHWFRSSHKAKFLSLRFEDIKRRLVFRQSRYKQIDRLLRAKF